MSSSEIPYVGKVIAVSIRVIGYVSVGPALVNGDVPDPTAISPYFRPLRLVEPTISRVLWKSRHDGRGSDALRNGLNAPCNDIQRRSLCR